MAAKIDQKRIERLVVKYRKDSTVFKHYRAKNKSGKKVIVMEAIASARSNLPLRLRSPKKYAAKLKQQKEHNNPIRSKYDNPSHAPSHIPYPDYVPNPPKWARAAEKVLSKPLNDVRALLTKYEKRERDLIIEERELIVKLNRVMAAQKKCHIRAEQINKFLSGKETITIVEWLLEDV